MSNFCLTNRARNSPYEHKIETVSPTGASPDEQALRYYKISLLIYSGSGRLSNAGCFFTHPVQVTRRGTKRNMMKTKKENQKQNFSFLHSLFISISLTSSFARNKTLRLKNEEIVLISQSHLHYWQIQVSSSRDMSFTNRNLHLPLMLKASYLSSIILLV